MTDSTENTTAVGTSETSEVSVKRTEGLQVSFPNGVSKNFGIRANILDDESFNLPENYLVVEFYLANGEYHAYSQTLPENTSQFIASVVAEGLQSRVKSALTGVSLEKSGEVIKKQFEKFSKEIFTTRSTGADSNVILTKLQLSYALAENLDVNKSEDFAKVVSFFATLSKEEKKALQNTPKVKLAWNTLTQKALAAEAEELQKELLA